jgi:hypothetical protein
MVVDAVALRGLSQKNERLDWRRSVAGRWNGDE